MKPYGVLMVEHRIIERGLRALSRETENAAKSGKADAALLLRIADFFGSYADAVHHGKEEDILFSALRRKPLSVQHMRTMEKLLEEHVATRVLVKMLRDSCGSYAVGDDASFRRILETSGKILELYASHIETEDKRFFIPASGYFNAQEQDRMLSEFTDFDRTQPKEKYEKMAKAFG